MAALDELFLTLRSRAGFSQQALAERSGVSARTISDIERGLASSPRAITLSLLEEALGLTQAERDQLRKAAAAQSPTPADGGTAGSPGELIGRAAEIGEAQRLLADDAVRLVTIVGGIGVGKTALAMHLARSLAAITCVNVVLLAAIADPELVPTRLAAALDARTVPGLSTIESVAAVLNRRPTLLVLDNVEHVAAAIPILADLLAAVPSLKICATSRAPLRIRLERLLHLSPLAVPTEDLEDAAAIASAPATAMLVDRFRLARPDFAVTSENASSVAQLARMLEGWPLAIELAAPLLRDSEPAEIVSTLGRRLFTLATERADVPLRQRTLSDAIEWSYALLSPTEQRAFQRLSVLRGGITVKAAQTVLGAPGAPAEALATLRVLGALVDMSLLRATDDEVEPRFEYYPFLREHAEQLLTSSDDDDAHHTYDRLFDYCSGVAKLLVRPEPSTHTLENRNAVAAEGANFDTAFAWTLATGCIERGLRLAIELWFYWWLRGAYLEGLGWLRPLLADAEAVARLPVDLAAEAHTAATGLAEVAGLLDEADAFGAKALAFARQDGRLGRISALTSGAAVRAGLRGQNELATQLHAESTAIRRQAGHPIGLAQALLDQGTHAGRCGDIAGGILHLEESLRWYRERDSRLGIALVFAARAEIALATSEFEQAESYSQTSLAIAHEVGHEGTVAFATAMLGAAALARGALAAAERLLRSAFAGFEASGDFVNTPTALDTFAELAHASGDDERAAQFLGAAAQHRDRLGLAIAPVQRGTRDRFLDRLRGGMTAPKFEAAFATGRQSAVDGLLAAPLT
jgi:predicted ATPase/DNA-binding XRE family transcriptional regulator